MCSRRLDCVPIYRLDWQIRLSDAVGWLVSAVSVPTAAAGAGSDDIVKAAMKLDDSELAGGTNPWR